MGVGRTPLRTDSSWAPWVGCPKIATVKIPILSCGEAGSNFTDIEFKELFEVSLETTKKNLSRDFGSWPPKFP